MNSPPDGITNDIDFIEWIARDTDWYTTEDTWRDISEHIDSIDALLTDEERHKGYKQRIQNLRLLVESLKMLQTKYWQEMDAIYESETARSKDPNEWRRR